MGKLGIVYKSAFHWVY